MIPSRDLDDQIIYNLIGHRTQLATPNQNWWSYMQPSLDNYLHAQNQRYRLIPFFYFYWDPLHARLNSHYKAWSYKKKKLKKIKVYRKSV